MRTTALNLIPGIHGFLAGTRWVRIWVWIIWVGFVVVQLGSGTSEVAGGETRDPLKWPFAATSIWNMPIGTGAVYVPAGLSGNPGDDVWARMPQVDREYIVLRPNAPLTAIKYSDAGWSGRDRCSPTNNTVLVTVPIPNDYLVSNSNQNNSATFLMSDNKTIWQSQPLARCNPGQPATSLYVRGPVDIYGEGTLGTHGGSRLSSFGGSLRVGELRPGGQPPRHALKFNVYAKGELYRCTTSSQCFRWPAQTADGYAVGWYGVDNPNSNPAMKMGSLLALPVSLNISTLGLETEPARMLAWTLQNYGAYIVDDTYAPGFAINAENGPDGSFMSQFQSDWGFSLEQRVRDNTPWVRDIQRLVKALHVVDNNGPNSIGGGGNPLQPLAPPFQVGSPTPAPNPPSGLKVVN